MESLVEQSQYTEIIEPQIYSRIIAKEHIYVSDAEQVLAKTIEKKIHDGKLTEVVELGCGPGNMFNLIANISNIVLTAIDIDQKFLNYSKNIATNNNLLIKIKSADIEIYQHNKAVDLFFSIGVHHHLTKTGNQVKYLFNIFKQLKSGGYYILADEFLPNYQNEKEREIKAVIWYSHIIANALSHNYTQLAVEEAKTLLDDLGTGRKTTNFKTNKQIDLVLKISNGINLAATTNNIRTAESVAIEFLNQFDQLYGLQPQGEKNLDLSRGDYKICDTVLREEAKQAGFIIEDMQSVGPIQNIGAMCIYVLKKPK